ncbi:ArsR/SmtB family transcription factor [Ilumatobacter sp.]|uniref:ArsR/SmtB family transcription factor n=1 Tax=Ilumatobacter sp. TaxID=1967498 RepID=UPI00375234D2
MISSDPKHHVGDTSYGDAAALLKALAHPGRLQIVAELANGDRCVHELVDILGIAQPTVSQHLQVLRAARLVTATRAGKENRYTLADHHVSHIVGDAIAHAAEHR